MGKWTQYDSEVIALANMDPGLTQIEIAKRVLGHKAKIDDLVAIRKHISKILLQDNDIRGIISENVRYKKEKQKAVDSNRIAQKNFREYARVENAIEEYAKELIRLNKQYSKGLSKIKFPNYNPKKDNVGVIQITDVHGNELIDLPHNKYDFKVLAKRLKKHVAESIRYFKMHDVNKVLIAFTGDLLNSDRRLDELLNQSTNRAKATLMMVHLLIQAITEVRMHYPISVISVLGNESRVNKEMSFSNESLSDNYDFTIVAQLSQVFQFAGIKGVDFKGFQNVREVVTIGEQKWLFAHNLSGMLDNQTKAQAEIGLMAVAGTKIDFIVGGHIHATRITDISARSASMAGSNTYNENALGLIGRASQNCYVVRGKDRFIQVNDLQNAENDGYEIVSQLEAYNAKSHDKLRPHRAIIEIVI